MPARGVWLHTKAAVVCCKWHRLPLHSPTHGCDEVALALRLNKICSLHKMECTLGSHTLMCTRFIFMAELCGRAAKFVICTQTRICPRARVQQHKGPRHLSWNSAVAIRRERGACPQSQRTRSQLVFHLLSHKIGAVKVQLIKLTARSAPPPAQEVHLVGKRKRQKAARAAVFTPV